MRYNARFPLVLVAAVSVMCTAAPASAQKISDQLQIHGFFTQGYGDASAYPIFGIPTDGTGELRALALQGRFNPYRSGQAVVQFSHRNLGESPLAAFEETIEVDWAYYQQRLGPVKLQAGKLPMPRGLFNEVRDVGTLLPFFKASKAFYSDGVETIEGALAGIDLIFGEWMIEGSAYVGGYDVRAQVTDENGRYALQSDIDNAVGGQLIVNTPIQGVRLGASGSWGHYEQTNQASDVFNIRTVSADASFDRWFARAEYETVNSEDYFTYEAWYAQAGVNVWDRLWLNGQVEFNTNTIDLPIFPAPLEVDALEDWALGAAYRLSPQVVFKAEHHWFTGYEVDMPVDPTGAPVENRYFVLSVSVAF